MLGNFMYCNPTKLYFGEDSLAGLNEQLPKYGSNVMLVYGGSIYGLLSLYLPIRLGQSLRDVEEPLIVHLRWRENNVFRRRAFDG